MTDRARLSVQVPDTLRQSVVDEASSRRVRISDVVRESLEDRYGSDRATRTREKWRREYGFLWADMSDPAQAKAAKKIWDESTHDQPPSPLPYSPEQDLQEIATAIEQIEDVEQIWTWVNQWR